MYLNEATVTLHCCAGYKAPRNKAQKSSYEGGTRRWCRQHLQQRTAMPLWLSKTAESNIRNDIQTCTCTRHHYIRTTWFVLLLSYAAYACASCLTPGREHNGTICHLGALWLVRVLCLHFMLRFPAQIHRLASILTGAHAAVCLVRRNNTCVRKCVSIEHVTI